VANVSNPQRYSEAEWKEIMEHLEREGLLEIDVYAGDEPLTMELRKKLGYPLSAEEALERMRAAQREQASSERKPA
jgi:hypothetical protein